MTLTQEKRVRLTGTMDRKVRMRDGSETLQNGSSIYGRIGNNEIYERGTLDRRETRMRSEFDVCVFTKFSIELVCRLMKIFFNNINSIKLGHSLTSTYKKSQLHMPFFESPHLSYNLRL